MNLFVVGWSSSGGLDAAPCRQALAEAIRDVPFLDDGAIETWVPSSGQAAFACVSHRPAQVGGGSYHSFEAGRAGLFSGRPFRWTAESEADGRGPIDPAFYAAGGESWMEDLDGRCAAVRYDDATRTLEVFANVLGSYPVYETTIGDTRWFSNSAGALGCLRGEAHDLDAIATFVGCGWSLGGQPLWRDVGRLARGTARRLSPAGDETVDLLPTESVVGLLGRGWNPPAAAGAITAAVRAMADWPGRPTLIPLTGGRDSRLVFAAASVAGIRFEAETTAQPGLEGYPDTEDVRLARMLCEATERPHRTKLPSPTLDLHSAIAAFRYVSPGAFSLGDVGLTPPEERRGPTDPLPILLQGLGGEVGRTFYGTGEGMDARRLERMLYRSTTKAWPRTLLSGDGQAVIRRYIGDWIDRHMGLGVAPVDIPDTFYLLERMVNWAAPTQGIFECMGGETTPVLWTSRLLPHQLGQTAQERASERFHVPVLEELAPELLDIPFELMNHPATIGAKVRSEVVRRLRSRRRGSASSNGSDPRPDPFPTTMAQVRELVLAQPQHEAWSVLDRKRVVGLLERDPRGLHSRSRHQVYRLASVFFTKAGASDPSAALGGARTGS